ncbi:MAG: apolipoprotein N-acyltransferase [Pseudomonadota bacterium]
MRRLFPNIIRRPLIALASGALSILAYAPYHIYPAVIIALAVFFYHLYTAGTSKQAAWTGFAFGLGFFCAGVSWIYVSLHVFGGMPWWMAGFATFTFCAFLALFTAAMGWLSFDTGKVLFAAPVFWVLFEWIRSWIFTGFPWLNVGYSQIPYGPLAGFAPVLGVYGVSLFVAFAASLLVLMCYRAHRKRALLAFIVVWIAGSVLKKTDWSQPLGEPFNVALMQGNISQDIKWESSVIQATLDQYLVMALQSKARLIVLPETALPVLTSDISSAYLHRLKTHAIENGGDILIGAVESDNGYYNSMLSVGNAVNDKPQFYRKSHLVPFGEYIPLKSVFGWIYRDWLNMPLTDLARGSIKQKPLQLAGQQVAVNICYEDVFGEEIIRQLPQATLLVNASNDAWYGRSLAAFQHLQMSQARALETGRMMLRATNTGDTAIIDTHGYILQQLPHFTKTTLEGTAQGYTGITPYVRWGNTPAIAFIFMSIAFLWAGKLAGFALSRQLKKK